MDTIKNLTTALHEHLESVNQLRDSDFDELYECLNKSNRIFISAAGRSLLQMKGFAMRLMHLDYEVAMVGEVTTPAIKRGDLIIVASGSGETSTILNQLKKAKALGANTFVITQNKDSSMAKETGSSIILPKIQSIQPGGTQFEQFLGICLDSFILSIMNKKELPFDYVYKNHANLE